MPYKRKGSSSKAKRMKKSNPLKQYNTRFNPDGSELVAQAMKNGIIIRLDPLEYPILLNPGVFVMESIKGGKGSSNKKKKTIKFDSAEFMRQNGLTGKPPNKRTVIKEMKKGLQNMVLTYYLLNEKRPFTPAQVDDQRFMGPTKQQAAPFYDLWKKAQDIKMQQYTNQGQKDAALAKAYSTAILDLAPYVASMSKKLKDNPDLKKYHERISKIKPKDFVSSAPRKAKSTPKKKTASQKTSKQALSNQEVLRLARQYNKGGARGKYTKFKSQYGVRNANRIKTQAAALRKKQTKKLPAKSQPKQTKKLTTSKKITYQRKKDKNGRFMHYKVDKQGKKTRITKAEYQKKKK